jgi:uncharacterized RDD family membrane protein YckC
MISKFRRGQGSPTQSLSTGNIVSIALQLYRANGSAYFLTSLLANLWLFLMSIGIGVGALILIIVAVMTIFRSSNRDFVAMLVDQLGLIILFTGLGLLILTPFLLYALARFTASGGFLSRQMFKVLQQQEEAIALARQQIFPRVWRYARGILWTGLVLTLTYLFLGLVGYVGYLAIAPWILTLADLQVSDQLSFLLGILAVVSALILLMLFFLAISYVAARLLLVDVVLALEDQVTALGSLTRSWQLTQGHAWRTLTVLFIGSVILTPAMILSSLLNAISVLPVMGLTLNVLIFPFWQAIKAVLYYDLRSRNEGMKFDLEASSTLPARFLKRVALQTPESIELDFALAGIGSRTLAWIIDQMILYLGLFLLTLGGAYIYLYAIYPWILQNLGLTDEQINQWAIALYLLVNFVLYNGYYIIFETIWQGQTIGKRVAQIRVVRDNGQPIGIKEAALRSLLQAVDFGLLFIGVFLITFNRSEKRLGDMAAGTLVIQDEQARQPPPKSLANAAGSVSQQIAQTLLESEHLRNLTPDQYLIIRDFLQHRQDLAPEPRLRSASKLAEQVKAVVMPAPASPELKIGDEDFLEAVYLAYRRARKEKSEADPLA